MIGLEPVEEYNQIKKLQETAEEYKRSGWKGELDDVDGC